MPLAIEPLLAVPRDLVREFMELNYNPLSLAVLARVLELDILSKLPAARSELPRLLGIDAEHEGALEMAITLAVGFGVLEEGPDGVRAGRLARSFLLPRAPLPLRGVHDRYARALGAIHLLGEALESIGRDNSVMYTDETSLEDQNRYFENRQSWDVSNRAYFWDSAALLLRAVSTCELHDRRVACDVGAGPAAFVTLLKRLHPSLRIIATDIAYRTESTRAGVERLLAAEGVDVELHAINFLREPLPIRPDLLTMNRVLSGVPPRAHTTWLRRARAALAPGGRLLVTDFFVTGDAVHDRTVAMLFALSKTWTFHRLRIQSATGPTALFSGEGWQAPMDVRDLARKLEAEGFVDVRAVPADPPFAVVEGTAPGAPT